MPRWPLLLVLVAGASAPVLAQDPAPAPGPAPRREVLRDRIEQNFLARAREEMSLTDEQSTRLLDVTRRMAERRRTLELENRRLNRVLAGEMRPGIAADPRLLRRTLDSVVDLRVAAAQVYRDEQRELSAFLTDVQRAQYHVLRERLLARVEEVRVQRAPVARRRP